MQKNQKITQKSKSPILLYSFGFRAQKSTKIHKKNFALNRDYHTIMHSFFVNCLLALLGGLVVTLWAFKSFFFVLAFLMDF